MSFEALTPALARSFVLRIFGIRMLIVSFASLARAFLFISGAEVVTSGFVGAIACSVQRLGDRDANMHVICIVFLMFASEESKNIDNVSKRHFLHHFERDI